MVKIGESSMLPIITEEISSEIFGEVFQDVQAWRKNMVQYLKEENPEVNTAILEVAKYDEKIDLKAVALGAYLSYRLIEVAAENDGMLIEEA
jgi:hypothetical protein